MSFRDHSYYPVHMRAAGLSNWSCRYVYVFIYVWSKATAVSCLTAQKSHRASSTAVSLHLLAIKLVCYSWWVVDWMLFLGILFMRTHTVSPHGVPCAQPPGHTHQLLTSTVGRQYSVFCAHFCAQRIQRAGYLNFCYLWERSQCELTICHSFIIHCIYILIEYSFYSEPFRM